MLGRCTVRLLEDYSIVSLLLGVGSLGCLIVGRLYSIDSLPSGVGSLYCLIVRRL